MSDWLSNNVTGLISVNQLHRGSKFKLTAHFLLLQTAAACNTPWRVYARTRVHTHKAQSLLFFFHFLIWTHLQQNQ